MNQFAILPPFIAAINSAEENSLFGALVIYIPFILCSLGGVLLALGELLETFGKWFLRHLLNRAVLSYTLLLVFCNVVTAILVYAILRYLLNIDGDLQLAIATGLTFPTLLRTRFTLYRPPSEATETDIRDQKAFSLSIEQWYRKLQNGCYEELQCIIAAERNARTEPIKKLDERKIINILRDQIAAILNQEKRQEYNQKLEKACSLKTEEERKRWLSLLVIDIVPEYQIKRLLKEIESTIHRR